MGRPSDVPGETTTVQLPQENARGITIVQAHSETYVHVSQDTMKITTIEAWTVEIAVNSSPAR